MIQSQSDGTNGSRKPSVVNGGEKQKCNTNNNVNNYSGHKIVLCNRYMRRIFEQI